MIGEAFTEHGRLWRHDGVHYALRASGIPASNRRRVTMGAGIGELAL